jgi:hypothetical protein
MFLPEHSSELGVGSIVWSEVRAIRLPQGPYQRVIALLPNFAVSIALAAVESFGI